MFSDAYITIENAAAIELAEKVSTKLDGSDFDPIHSRIISHALPFYNGYHLCEMTDLESSPTRKISFIYKENGGKNDIFVLDGTNEPIYSLNKQVPIFLNNENIITYTRFFFHYVRGRFGRFNIVENVDEISWREEPAPSGRQALAKMIKPLAFKDLDKNETYHLSCSIVFKDSLFESDIIVKENGDVSLSNQEMLVEDIPVLDDSFQQ
jgi:hypothetical protein